MSSFFSGEVEYKNNEFFFMYFSRLSFSFLKTIVKDTNKSFRISSYQQSGSVQDQDSETVLPSLATGLYHPSLPVDLPSYILYQYRVVVDRS